MKKIIFILFLINIFFYPFFVFAEDKNKEAGRSAYISYKKILYKYSSDISSFSIDRYFFYKKYTIKKILEKYNSPLVNNVDDFIQSCFYYEIDCYFLPAIAGLESKFGHYVIPNSFNPFGWGGGYIFFTNWADAIDKVAYGIKNNYLNRGLENIEQIGRIYSESSNWAKKIEFFINEFEKEEENLRLYFEKNEVKL